jgi:hypothetical protein
MSTRTASAMISLHQAATKAEVSYRQAHYWGQRGLIEVTDQYGNVGMPGSGHQAYVSARQTKVIRYMGLLVGIGIDPKNAARYAQEMVETRHKTVTAANGVKLIVHDPAESERRDDPAHPV